MVSLWSACLIVIVRVSIVQRRYYPWSIFISYCIYISIVSSKKDACLSSSILRNRNEGVCGSNVGKRMVYKRSWRSYTPLTSSLLFSFVFAFYDTFPLLQFFVDLSYFCCELIFRLTTFRLLTYFTSHISWIPSFLRLAHNVETGIYSDAYLRSPRIT